MNIAMLGADYPYGFAVAGDAEQPDTTWAETLSKGAKEIYLAWQRGQISEDEYRWRMQQVQQQKRWYQDGATLTILGVGAVVGLVVLTSARRRRRRRR